MGNMTTTTLICRSCPAALPAPVPPLTTVCAWCPTCQAARLAASSRTAREPGRPAPIVGRRSPRGRDIPLEQRVAMGQARLAAQRAARAERKAAAPTEPVEVRAKQWGKGFRIPPPPASR